jgi:hypothetical protein
MDVRRPWACSAPDGREAQVLGAGCALPEARPCERLISQAVEAPQALEALPNDGLELNPDPRRYQATPRQGCLLERPLLGLGLGTDIDQGAFRPGNLPSLLGHRRDPVAGTFQEDWGQTRRTGILLGVVAVRRINPDLDDFAVRIDLDAVARLVSRTHRAQKGCDRALREATSSTISPGLS